MKWNNSGTKYLKIRVILHESELEFNISPKSYGKYLFDLVCSTVGLRETWYFGLQFYSFLPNGRIRFSHWLKLDKKIIAQKPDNDSKPLCFFFHTKFFPEDVEQELIQATTRHLFYLSVKAIILNRNESNVNGNLSGDLCPSLDVAILLSSLAAQAEYGDLCEDDLSDTEELALPPHILRLIPTQLWTQIQSTQGVAQKFREYYKQHKGMNRDKAELQYLKVAQAHHLFGVDFFPIVCVRMKCPRNRNLAFSLNRNDLTTWRNLDKHHTNAWLGVTAAGIQLYGKSQHDPPQHTFPWNLIKDVSYRERKFTIKLITPWRGPGKAVSAQSTAVSGNTDSGGPNPLVYRPHNSSRSPSGRSPLLLSSGQHMTNLTVGSSAAGSGTSAASLPSTPVSSRLISPLPPVTTAAFDPSGSSLSPSKFRITQQQQQHCQQLRLVSEKESSGSFGKVFELGCISALIPKSKITTTNDPIIGRTTVGCLRSPRIQTTSTSASTMTTTAITITTTATGTDCNTGVTSSSSSKASFHSSSGLQMISVVEVWLADPSQAKTIMSMCTGNHSLFMRRRQPDTVEVQQMRAQAREERARREVERSRLARARAEKAEALEAKLALEARCAQLEQALRRQQSLQQARERLCLMNEFRTEEPHGTPTNSHPTNKDSPSNDRPSPSNELSGKVAFSVPAEFGFPYSTEAHTSDFSEPKYSNGERKMSSGANQNDPIKDNTVAQGGSSDPYFDECTFYTPEEFIDPNDLSYHHEQSWDNPEFEPYRQPPQQQSNQPGFRSGFRFGTGSISTPVTPHMRRARAPGPPIEQWNSPYPVPGQQTRYSGPTSYSSKGDPIGCPILPPGAELRAASFYPQFSSQMASHLMPHWPCDMNTKSMWPTDSHLVCDIIPNPVDRCYFRQPTGPPFASLMSGPGSLPALHNGVLCHQAMTDPFKMPSNNCSRWMHPLACAQPDTCRVFNPFSSHPVPPQSFGPSLGQPDCSNSCTTRKPYFDRMPTAFGPGYADTAYGSPCDPYIQPSASLAAILSPVAAQRLQHLHAQNQLESGRGLRRQQSHPPKIRPLRTTQIPPLMERSSSQGQLNSQLAHSGSDAKQKMERELLNPTAYRGYSLQHIPCQVNLPEPHLNSDRAALHNRPNCADPQRAPFVAHTKPNFRRAASLGVSAWNVDPASMNLPYPPDMVQHFPPDDLVSHLVGPDSQRDFISTQLQAERAHFALLQAQFSQQLCDTWAYLKATRVGHDNKPYDMNAGVAGNMTYSELRHDPAGASDGASTAGACGAVAYDGLDQIPVAVMDQTHGRYDPGDRLTPQNFDRRRPGLRREMRGATYIPAPDHRPRPNFRENQQPWHPPDLQSR